MPMGLESGWYKLEQEARIVCEESSGRKKRHYISFLFFFLEFLKVKGKSIKIETGYVV